MHKIFSNSLFIGKKLVHLPKCHSTNSIAADLVSHGQSYEGTVIITDHQTSGRGQRGSAWESGPGENLTFSVILKPTFLTPQQQFYLTIVSSLAVFASVDKKVEGLKIKWPNDIYVGSKKICGILIENSIKGGKIETSVIGIGLNVNQREFSVATASSLRNLSGEEFSHEQLLGEICVQLEVLYLKLKSGKMDELKHSYLDHFLGLNEERYFRDGKGEFPGVIQGITELGQLVIKTEAGNRIFNLKEVQFVV